MLSEERISDQYMNTVGKYDIFAFTNLAGRITYVKALLSQEKIRKE